MSNNIFTHYSQEDGHFGTGTIPEDLKQYTESLRVMFYKQVPENKKKEMTYHIWYDQFPDEIKQIVNNIQSHNFWKSLCLGGSQCTFINLSQMDELYYSKAPYKKNKGILYGASTNYDVHVDGIFRFPGIRFYRVLIGLTENENVETHFPRLEQSKYINTNDYVIFDFDRAQHKVINHSSDDVKYRILLKLHFCVCDRCTSHNSSYFKMVCNMYIWYEYVTRYIMKTGTNPETYYQFFWGLLAYIFSKKPWIMFIYLFLIMIYFVTRSTLIGQMVIYITLIYLVLVVLFWGRFRIFNIR